MSYDTDEAMVSGLLPAPFATFTADGTPVDPFQTIPDTPPARPPRTRPSRRTVAIGFILALLIVIGAAAAALSFASIAGLALQCGIAEGLAWLLPIVIDAGVVAGTIVWLSRRLFPNADARKLAAGYTVALLAVSIAANVTNHVLLVRHLDADLWVIIPVSAIAPATVFVVVHLAVTALRPPADPPADADAVNPVSTPDDADTPADADAGIPVRADADTPASADTEEDPAERRRRRDRERKAAARRAAATAGAR